MFIFIADLDLKIRNLKMLKAKVDEALEQFEAEVINFLQENPECETTDKKANQSFNMLVLIIKQPIQNSPVR